MTEMCRLQGKQRWVEKSPNNMQFVSDLDRRFPTARFIHVIRDGRSVAVSQRRHGGAKYSRDPQRQLILVLMIQRTGFGNSDGSEIRAEFTELAVDAIGH